MVDTKTNAVHTPISKGLFMRFTFKAAKAVTRNINAAEQEEICTDLLKAVKAVTGNVNV